MKQEIATILQGVADSSILVGSNSLTNLSQSTERIIEIFQKWLIDQAHKDCKDGKDYRQTRAFDLSNRLLREL